MLPMLSLLWCRPGTWSQSGPSSPSRSLPSVTFNRAQKSIKTEKDGEEKVKKPRFPSILGPQRRPSRVEAGSGEPSQSDTEWQAPQALWA